MPLLLVITSLGFPILGVADSDFLGRIEGFYTTQAPYCTENDGGVSRPCDPPVEQCLLIKRIDRQHAKFSFYTMQLNSAECGVNGIGTVKDNALTYTDGDPRDVTSFREGLSIYVDHGRVKFKYLEPPKPGTSPFCGINGNIERIEFALKNREAAAGHTCGE